MLPSLVPCSVLSACWSGNFCVVSFSGNVIQLSERGKRGKVRAMAITNSNRYPLMPELPTVAEAGIPGFAVNNWTGVFVPAATPPAVVTRLNAEFVKVLAMPDVKKRLMDNGIAAVSNTPQQFAAYIRDETAKWASVIKDANVKLD